MADYGRALRKTDPAEGGWSNDPDDAGGETWRGIARNFHPRWTGWALVDAHRDHPRFPFVLRELPELDLLTVAFYKAKFWDVHRGDENPSQAIAEEVYDTGVNLGFTRAAVFLRRTLNVFNNRAGRWPDVPQRGPIDDAVLAALRAALVRPPIQTAYGPVTVEELLFKALNSLQGAGYIERAEASEVKEKYMNGWFAWRVISFREWQRRDHAIR